VIYREAGQFKSSYGADQAIFPIVQDRVVMGLAAVAAFVAVPLAATEYWLQAVLIPFLIYALAALGLNLLTGYAGQLSLGTGGFMAVGAYAGFKLTTAFPALNILAVFLLAGLAAALVGVVFGIPSLRIKGFYLAVATLASQFFLIWLFNKVGWFVNYAPSGTATAPPRTMLGVMVTGPQATAPVRYLVALTMVIGLAFVAKNLVRGRVGRSWMAIRDRDIAAEIIGIRPLPTKLLAFAISSFYAGMTGVLYTYFLGIANYEQFQIGVSIDYLAMIIIGGLGSVLGSIFGAIFVTLLPIVIRLGMEAFGGLFLPQQVVLNLIPNLRLMMFGALIVFFLIVEPDGLNRLWRNIRSYFRIWPFAY